MEQFWAFVFQSSLKDIKALPVDESEARDDDLKTLSSGYAILVVTFIYIVIAVAFFITFSCSHSKPSQAR
ncbi:unnamed protein product [Heligmosomoides polygyrus]|uniref:Transmembrane protein n=1 Tax=Heligmosomoides polygyrus TaxID=6339 RepID=A0A183GBU3_HELPZ|nr:unnamed protein product [Heligmosomoides polygyrus]